MSKVNGGHGLLKHPTTIFFAYSLRLWCAFTKGSVSGRAACSEAPRASGKPTKMVALLFQQAIFRRELQATEVLAEPASSRRGFRRRIVRLLRCLGSRGARR